VPSKIRFCLATAAVISVALSVIPGVAGAGKWSGTKPVASKSRLLTGFSTDVGDNGYAVMAYVVPGESLPGDFEGAVFIKVRRPGEKYFRPALFRGITHTPFTDVEIGPGGMSLVTYRGENGRWRIATRWPWGDWLPTQELQGSAGIPEVQIRIGREAYAAIVGIDTGSDDRTVLLSTRDPQTGLFSDWLKVSGDPSRVGDSVSVSPGRFGRWTVVWSAPCSAEGGNEGASWTEVNDGGETEISPVPGAGCVTRGIDIQSDRRGNQYLKLSLVRGIQLATRKGNGKFGLATTVSDPDDRTDGGHLSVSGNGLATLVWGHVREGGYPRDSYLYVRSRLGSSPSMPRKMKGVRLGRRSRNDVLKGVSPLPHGGLALAFTRSWFTRSDLVRMKAGVAEWKPGSRMKPPVYTRGGPAGRFISRIGVETSFRGAKLLWWSTQTELTARPLGFWWRARF